MRALRVAFAVVVAAAAGGIAPAVAQSGYDRPGGDFSSASIPNGDPAVCATRCERDKNCRAWSFSYPSASGSPAMCFLKRGEVEYSIDRSGGDYRAFETPPDPKGQACDEACHGEQRCRAWTYRRPGYGAAAARCFLKETIKPPRRRPCCISGVVR